VTVIDVLYVMLVWQCSCGVHSCSLHSVSAFLARVDTVHTAFEVCGASALVTFICVLFCVDP
jgi:hypothetical protein